MKQGRIAKKSSDIARLVLATTAHAFGGRMAAFRFLRFVKISILCRD